MFLPLSSIASLPLDLREEVYQELVKLLNGKYIYIDLEVDVENHSIHRIGLDSPGRSEEVFPDSFENSLQGSLVELRENGFTICGHNFRRFDASYFFRQYPTFLPWRSIDTLELSVIVRPLQVSHRLRKDYKSSEYAGNNPLEDARATKRLLHDLVNEFLNKPPSLQQAYRWLFTCGTEEADLAYRELFDVIGLDSNDLGPPVLSSLPEEAIARFDRGYLLWLWEHAATLSFESRLCVAALIAWNYESHITDDAPSFTRWLTYLKEFPRVLENMCPLSPDGFTYHPYLEYFGIKNFRSFQEEIVSAIIGGTRPLVVMPTGGGKSLCYQLPALMMYERQRALTVVISPLQALMADQVADLEANGLHFATFINGTLTAEERGNRLEQLYRGMKGLLYISPEQLRSISIRALLEDRPPALWIIDEAHCISQWGHSFRPDYRYVPQFIRQLYGERNLPLPRLALMTATATANVRDDIKTLFAEYGLEISREIVTSSVRENLQFEVIQYNGDKESLLLAKVREITASGGCTLVYTITRKKAQQLAEILNASGIEARYYHGKISRGDKEEILRAFKEGELNVVTATCAFGMGINRHDVRAVIHHSMSANLENYIQEAGRAGRDGNPATCTLLFDESDADTIFFLQSLNRLSKTDLENIFISARSIRNRVYRQTSEADWFWVTVAEIFRASELDNQLEAEQQDTKVKVALHNLESFGLIERAENLSTFIDFSLVHDTPLESLSCFRQYSQLHHFSSFQVERFERLILGMHSLKNYYRQRRLDDRVPIERLSDESGIEPRELKRAIEELKQARVCSLQIPITLQITRAGRGAARTNLDRVCRWERELLEVLVELQENSDRVQVNLRSLTVRLDPDGTENLRSATLMDILDGWAGRNWVTLERVSQDVVRLHDINVVEHLESHQTLATAIIDALYRQLGEQRGTVQVECELEQLLSEINREFPLFRRSNLDLEAELLWLHQRRLIRLIEGLNLFQQALKIRIVPRANITSISRRYPDLEAYYRDEAYRTHIMVEYGKLPGDQERQQLVIDYFQLQPDEFVQGYPDLDTPAVKRPVTQADYERIMGPLNAVQREIVLAEDPAIAVIAGPGSGKTRTIVHRIAYLIKVKRVSPDRVMVLAYNRNAVRELRLRLRDLIGDSAHRLRVFTFHGLALALLGRAIGEERREVDFDEILRQACSLIEQGDELDDGESQARRINLLGNLEYIFVDEYQDVAEYEYRLIQLLAGLGESEDHSRSVQINLCVIGDDDQNIYEFRETDVRYICQFESEYNARQFLLIENYRSSRPIIEAANNLIRNNNQRCKQNSEEQVRINQDRQEETGLPVNSLDFSNPFERACWIQEQIQRWLDEGIHHNEIAILAREWNDLGRVRLLLEQQGINTYALKRDGIRLVRNRVARCLVDKLQESPNLILSSCESVSERFQLFFNRGGRDASEPTVRNLLKIARDIDQERGYGNDDTALSIGTNEIVTSIYEFDNSGETFLDDSAVLVTSCHGAKGLEFRKVILLTDNFKYDKKRIESERRLFYVAMTRAKEELILCSIQESQFIEETGVVLNT
jgi:ATP-dependent DNA helicase RecQ